MLDTERPSAVARSSTASRNRSSILIVVFQYVLLYGR
jgi:hypothetical protein